MGSISGGLSELSRPKQNQHESGRLKQIQNLKAASAKPKPPQVLWCWEFAFKHWLIILVELPEVFRLKGKLRREVGCRLERQRDVGFTVWSCKLVRLYMYSIYFSYVSVYRIHAHNDTSCLETCSIVSF